MAVWTLIAVAVGICWVLVLTLGWLLCRAAQRGDQEVGCGTVVPLKLERLPRAAQRR
jgi:hypothetical protein